MIVACIVAFAILAVSSFAALGLAMLMFDMLFGVDWEI